MLALPSPYVVRRAFVDSLRGSRGNWLRQVLVVNVHSTFASYDPDYELQFANTRYVVCVAPVALSQEPKLTPRLSLSCSYSPTTRLTICTSRPTAYSDHSAYPSSSAYSFTPQPNFGYDSLSDLPAFHDYDYPTYDHVHEPIQYAEPSAVYTEPYSFGAATQSAYSSHANLPFENAESYTTTTDYDQDSIFAYSVTEPRSSVSEYEYPLEMQPVVEPPTCEPAASFSKLRFDPLE